MKYYKIPISKPNPVNQSELNLILNDPSTWIDFPYEIYLCLNGILESDYYSPLKSGQEFFYLVSIENNNKMLYSQLGKQPFIVGRGNQLKSPYTISTI